MEPTLLRLGSRVELLGSAGWTPAVVDGALAPGRVRLLVGDGAVLRGNLIIAPRVPALQVPGGRAFGYAKQ